MKVIVFTVFLGGFLILVGCSDEGLVSPDPETTTDATIPPQETMFQEGVAAYPGWLFISINDPCGDNTGDIDVIMMEMGFNKSTGDYVIQLVADEDRPFVGEFRVNVNLFNPDVGTTTPNPSFFSDAVNDYNLIDPTTRIVLTGVNLWLTSWDLRDEVFTNSLEGTGNPDGTSLFRSSVTEVPFSFLTNEDFIAFDDAARPVPIRDMRRPRRNANDLCD